MKTALTIAGSDPTGGAGLQADLKTFHAYGVYGFSIPTSLTAQNTKGVHGVYQVPADFFSAQIDALLKDVRPDALKTGMLYSQRVIEVIADKIKEFSLLNLVVDPVTVSSSGTMLLEEGGVDSIKKHLLPIAKAVTPNLNEVHLLTGISINNENEMKDAAKKMKEFGTEAIIITGGHFTDRALDLLYDGEEFTMLESKMLTGDYHGTGCVYSSALTAGLALGHSIKESFISAKDFVYKAMKSANTLGTGMKVLKI